MPPASSKTIFWPSGDQAGSRSPEVLGSGPRLVPSAFMVNSPGVFTLAEASAILLPLGDQLGSRYPLKSRFWLRSAWLPPSGFIAQIAPLKLSCSLSVSKAIRAPFGDQAGAASQK